MARGLTLEDARTYNIIGCVEPQKAGKTDGWHDAAFFNMCRPFEFALHDGRDGDVQVGPHTGDAAQFTTFEEVYEAYQKQMNYFIRLLVNADNAIDVAHAERTPLPFLSSMVEDCISEGKSVQEGGAVYNFTGPQGFGVANMADSLYTIKKLVFEEKRFTMAELIEAVDHNFGHGVERHMAEKVVAKGVCRARAAGQNHERSGKRSDESLPDGGSPGGREIQEDFGCDRGTAQVRERRSGGGLFRPRGRLYVYETH